MLIGWVLLITVVSSLANGLPAYALSRRMGMTRNEGVSMASLINMPGLMVLIVLNIGYDLQVLPPVLFAVLLSAAMNRNLLVAPVLRRLLVQPTTRPVPAPTAAPPLVEAMASSRSPSGDPVETTPAVDRAPY